jgi:hypothetical protein
MSLYVSYAIIAISALFTENEIMLYNVLEPLKNKLLTNADIKFIINTNINKYILFIITFSRSSGLFIKYNMYKYKDINKKIKFMNVNIIILTKKIKILYLNLLFKFN